MQVPHNAQLFSDPTARLTKQPTDSVRYRAACHYSVPACHSTATVHMLQDTPLHKTDSTKLKQTAACLTRVTSATSSTARPGGPQAGQTGPYQAGAAKQI